VNLASLNLTNHGKATLFLICVLIKFLKDSIGLRFDLSKWIHQVTIPSTLFNNQSMLFPFLKLYLYIILIDL
jgi:hypothetical protein